MADASALPPGYTIDPHSVLPAGYKIDPVGAGGAPGSVFESTGQKFKRLGKAIAPGAAGGSMALAGAEGGAAVGGLPGAIGGAIMGGLAAPFVERQVASAATGQKFDPPTTKEVIKSGLINGAFAAFGGIGTALKAGGAAEVAPEIKALPQAAQTAGNVKQAVRNREFWTQMGLDHPKIDEALASPDVMKDVEKAAQAGKNYKAAFQTTLNSTRDQFTDRYSAVFGSLGKFEDVKVDKDLVPILREKINETIKQVADRAGPAAQGAKQFGGMPPDLATNLAHSIGDNASLQDLRAVRTQLRRLASQPSAGNPLKAAVNQINDQITTTIDDTLKGAGATSEQIAGSKAIDEEYGRFIDTVDKLDPRSENYGTDVAKALFDPMVKNPNDAMNFIKMAKSAEVANPGVMPQLKAAFSDKLIDETRAAAQGRPVEEMRLLQNMQKQWGGQKGTKAVLDELYGPDSPFSSPTKMASVLGKLSNSDQAAKDASNGILKQAGDLIKSPAMLTRLAVGYGIYRAVAGGTGSPWKDLSKPEIMIPALAAIWFSGKVANVAFGSADRAFQKAYVDFVTNPNARSLAKVSTLGGSIATGLEAQPNDPR